MSKPKKLERKLVSNFVNFLRSEKDFPNVVLNTEYSLLDSAGKVVSMDLVLPDQNDTGFNAIFEFTNDLRSLNSRAMRLKVLSYVHALGKVRKGAFLVGSGDSPDKRFKIYQVFDEDRMEEVEERNFQIIPSF